ncbi:MAG: hypothetical protein SVY15_08575 [Halobacteriota archaeon]|nr:hypothetical protein [Halobacteriota archaeon]
MVGRRRFGYNIPVIAEVAHIAGIRSIDSSSAGIKTVFAKKEQNG